MCESKHLRLRVQLNHSISSGEIDVSFPVNSDFFITIISALL